MINTPQCFFCKHFEIKSCSCPAYPQGIPDEIYTSKIAHNKTLFNQKENIFYEEQTNIFFYKDFINK